MRRRLVWVSLVLLVLLLVSLVVPLVRAYATNVTADLAQDTQGAATRFAILAGESTDEDLGRLGPDLRRYAEVYDAQVWVLDQDQRLRASSGPGGVPEDPAVAGPLARALDGEPSPRPDVVWPWDQEPLVVATPVGRDAQVLGAVAIARDTDSAREAVALVVAAAVLGGLAVLALAAWLVAIPVVGWIARPVEELEGAARRLADGDLETRARPDGPPELQRLATAFNTMASSVELSRQQQQDLVSDVSHQLANPLTALRLRMETSARHDETLEPVLTEVDRISHVLEGLIEVSRAGGFDRTPGPVDVAAQLRDRVGLWEPLFADLLRLDLPGGAAPAVLEEDLVPTVVDALLDNAVKYAPGAALDVALRASPSGPWWELEVRDHGPGVTPDEADGLGRRFHRLARHADLEGTGLGLAIVHGRVRDAGGEVVIAPAEPGTCVAVRLPRAPGTTAATPGGAAAAG